MQHKMERNDDPPYTKVKHKQKLKKKEQRKWRHHRKFDY